jgi:hypothetical protein
MAADDVAAALGEVSVGPPFNGILESPAPSSSTSTSSYAKASLPATILAMWSLTRTPCTSVPC